MDWLKVARKVVEEKQFAEHDGILLDLFTASMLVQVYDALGEVSKAKFAGFHLTKAVSIGWKVTR